jgi:transposase
VNDAHSSYQEYTANPAVLIKFIEERDQEIVARDQEILRLQQIIFKLAKGQYGTQSERRQIEDLNEQLRLLLEQPPTVVAAPAVAPTVIEVPAHTRAARTKRDFSKLPHTIIELTPESTTCKCCGKELVKIGTEDVSKELEYVPAKLLVNQYVRPRYACGSCKNEVVQASLPDEVKPLSRSIAGAGLLSQILVSKYVDHLPLHRQEQMFARLGFEIPRKSMCEWIGRVVEEYLLRLHAELKKEALKEQYLLGDETTIKVQDGEVEGKCHQGYLWGMVSPKKEVVVFEYSPSRAGSVAAEVFKGFTGVLQTDLYAGYNTVMLPDKVERLACLAHVRRKFIEVENISPREAGMTLQIIGELYGLERKWQSLEPPQRLEMRRKKSVPVLAKLHAHLQGLAEKTLPKAPLMAAVQYALVQWHEIERIFESGEYHLDNNMIEREMRPIAVGRKNFLFAGSHEGAKRAAVIYSLFATARLHKVNPLEWLKDVLKTMRGHPVNDIAALLPHRWKNNRALKA